MAMNAVEFIAALEEIEASKGISKETILDMLQESLIKAYRKQLGGDDADVRVNIDPEKGIIDMCQVKAVVDEVEDDFLQISVQDANDADKSKKYKAGDDGTDFVFKCFVKNALFCFGEFLFEHTLNTHRCRFL